MPLSRSVPPPTTERAHVLQALIVGVVAIVTVVAAFAVSISGSA